MRGAPILVPLIGIELGEILYSMVVLGWLAVALWVW